MEMKNSENKLKVTLNYWFDGRAQDKVFFLKLEGKGKVRVWISLSPQFNLIYLLFNICIRGLYDKYLPHGNELSQKAL